MDNKYCELAVKKTIELLSIDSPSGYTENVENYVINEFKSLGYETIHTNKGGVLINLGAQSEENQGAILFAAHADTLGAMVTKIKDNGRLYVTNVGGMNANNAETENCRIITKFDGLYEGTLQLKNASLHVNGEYNNTSRTFDNMEVLLDEIVTNADDVKKLGIETGDFVCFDPRTRVTEKGYIKSRFLDDKLSVGMLISLATYIKENNIELSRKVYILITVYEETGHGASASIPLDVTEAIAVDMGCVGEGLNCTERQVSICPKDGGGPYSYDVVKKLIAAAKKENADYAVDVYPFYHSDTAAMLAAGNDIKHGLIGAGVYASHGYERSHKDGVLNTLKVLKGYLEI